MCRLCTNMIKIRWNNPVTNFILQRDLTLFSFCRNVHNNGIKATAHIQRQPIDPPKGFSSGRGIKNFETILKCTWKNQQSYKSRPNFGLFFTKWKEKVSYLIHSSILILIPYFTELFSFCFHPVWFIGILFLFTVWVQIS